MGEPFIHSVLVEEADPAADTIASHDLPVTPLSGLLLELKPLNETATITDYQTAVGILDAINSIRVLHRGKTVLDIRGRDLWAALQHRWRADVTQSNMVQTDNDRRSIVIPIMFGRHWGDPTEGLPATTAGELVLRLDLDVAGTGYDDLRYQVEALELPDATFAHFNRMTTIAQTFAATGNNDIILPVGWPYRGLLLFNTTEFAGAAPAPGLGRLSIRRDGVEQGYVGTDFERLRGLFGALGKTHSVYSEHRHHVIVNDTVDVFALNPQDWHQQLDEFAYMDFDFTRDDRYILETKGANRLVLRSDAEVAEAMRVILIEKVPVADFF